MRPKVSVLMTAYNSEPYITEAVESVLSQPSPSLELVVVNDGSTDLTEHILRGYHSQIKLFNQPNAGACNARNRAWRECLGKYVIIMDSDDRLSQNALQGRVDFLDAHPELDLVYGDTIYIDETGRSLGTVVIPWKLRGDESPYFAFACSNVFPVHAALTRRQVFERLGTLHSETTDLVGDWDLWARVAEHNRMAYLPGVVAEYRIHSTMSIRNLKRRRGLNQTLNTSDRIIGRTAFETLNSTTQCKAFVRYTVTAGRLGYWEKARIVTKRGLRLRPFAPRLLGLYLLSSSWWPFRCFQRIIENLWG